MMEDVTVTIRTFRPENHRIRVLFQQDCVRLFTQGFDGALSCGISEFMLTEEQARDLAAHLVRAADLAGGLKVKE